MQIKEANGFAKTAIEKLVFFTDDLLDLSLHTSTLGVKYHARLLGLMQIFKDKYLRLAGNFPDVSVDYYYITRGDEVRPDTKARDAADKVKQVVSRHLSGAGCTFHFVNAQGLLRQIRKRRLRERVLLWAENPMHTEEGYVGLVRLRDYFEFITDEHGGLDERMFESNVRGFQQNTQVNIQLRQSLASREEANFWLLNNGITVICSEAQSSGVRRLNLEDPQIVNGLQTSREIFTYFRQRKDSEDELRTILVKVINTRNEVVRDAVIKATNSQNQMNPASLRATDPIHHQIEDLFRTYSLFYDRRKGFYKDQGKPIKKILSVTELVQAIVSVLLQRPDDARARPSNYIKDDEKYESIFGTGRVQLATYWSCISMVRHVDDFLSTLDLERGEKRNIKFYLAAYLACYLTEQVEITQEKLLEIDTAAINNDMTKKGFDKVWKKYDKLGGTDTVARGPDLIKQLKADLRRQHTRKRRRAGH